MAVAYEGTGNAPQRKSGDSVTSLATDRNQIGGDGLRCSEELFDRISNPMKALDIDRPARPNIIGEVKEAVGDFFSPLR